jgi:hypothetical protein
MRRFMIIMVIMFICMSSILNAKSSPVQNLQKNIKTWEQFRWQGIIQLQSSAFTMRKNFTLNKNRDAIRIDILDSGIMGLNAKPLVSLYLKDSVVLDAPTVKQLEGLDPNWFIPKAALQKFVHFADSLAALQQEILSTHVAKSGSTIFTFDKKYRLISAKNPEVGFETGVIYNRHNQPTKILIKYTGKPLAELQINDREYGNIEIEPLTIQNGSDTSDTTKSMEQK